MISVPNLRLPLSGNKQVLILAFLIFSVSCSPKIRVKKPEEKEPAEKPETAERPGSKDKLKESNSIALLLPFELNQINPASASPKEISKAGLAIDFYQGFKLALDSIAADGGTFKLNVFDSQDNDTRVVNLARAQSINNNDLIIGPVFPNGIKTFSEFASLKQKLMVSPLAATMPSQFSNPNLVTITNTIDQHGWKIADFINRKYKPGDVNVVLINTRKSEDEKFAAPVRRYLKELSGSKFTISEIPNAIGIEEKLSASKTNLVIISSSERSFIVTVIDKLYALGSQGNYKIDVFGHPNWARVKNFNVEKFQWLNTRITSSYHINYQDNDVKDFVARYRDEFQIEPSEYAFKGFDTGYYFGKLLARYGDNYVKHITDGKYEGLHNDFKFVQNPKSGYLNTELNILQYRGYELEVLR